MNRRGTQMLLNQGNESMILLSQQMAVLEKIPYCKKNHAFYVFPVFDIKKSCKDIWTKCFRKP